MIPSDLSEHIQVRRSTPADAPAIIAGIEAVCAEGIYFQTDAFVTNRHWEAVLYRPESVPQHLLAVAELEGEIIGAVRLFAGMCGSKDRHVADLGIFVLQPYRGRGVGRKLVAYALAWAASEGLEKVALSVLASNQPAIQLYESVKFTLEGRRKMQYNVGGVYVDELFMAKFL